MNRPDESGAASIADCLKPLGKLDRVIQVPTLKQQWQSRDVVEHRFKLARFFPDVAVDGKLAEPQPERRRPLNVHPRVPLLILHDPRQSKPEFRRRFRKPQRDIGHHLERLQFMIGENVMRDRPFSLISKPPRLRHRRSRPPRRKSELLRPSRLADRHSLPWSLISQSPVRLPKFVLQSRTPQHPLSKRTHFHREEPCPGHRESSDLKLPPLRRRERVDKAQFNSPLNCYQRSRSDVSRPVNKRLRNLVLLEQRQLNTSTKRQRVNHSSAGFTRQRVEIVSGGKRKTSPESRRMRFRERLSACAAPHSPCQLSLSASPTRHSAGIRCLSVRERWRSGTNTRAGVYTTLRTDRHVPVIAYESSHSQASDRAEAAAYPITKPSRVSFLASQYRARSLT